MRFFKFGDNGQVLAIALPNSAKKSANISEDQEYEFIDLGEGALLLVSRKKMDELAKSSLLGKLGEKFLSINSSLVSNSITSITSVENNSNNKIQFHSNNPQSSSNNANSIYSDNYSKSQVKQPTFSSNSPVSPVVITSALNIPQFNLKEIEAALAKEGFVVLEEDAAKSASIALEFQIKSGNVVGVRGFDKKYYIVAKWFFEKTNLIIRSNASGAEYPISQIATLSGISESAAIAIIQVMKENGDVLERRKGFFKVLSS